MCDTRTVEQLEAAGAIPPDGVEDVFVGGDLLDPEGFDLVAFSQSVLRQDAALRRARQLGIPVTSQMRLLPSALPGAGHRHHGSSGKSTTTALVGAMAR